MSLIFQIVLVVCGAFGGTFLAHLLTGNPYNYILAVVVSLGGIIGLMIAEFLGVNNHS